MAEMTAEECRFWSRVDVRADNECWLWQGHLINGYGVFCQSHADRIRAHRYAYETMVGAIPEGKELDHLCRVRNCVNPAHLEPVTNKENVLRGEGVTAQNARKTHCPHGHPYSGDNLYVTPKGYRGCRECRRAAHRAWKVRIRALPTKESEG